MIWTYEDEKEIKYLFFDVEKQKYNQKICYNIIIINFAYSIGGSYNDLMIRFNML